jgi:hypothetical protein
LDEEGEEGDEEELVTEEVVVTTEDGTEVSWLFSFFNQIPCILAYNRYKTMMF